MGIGFGKIPAPAKTFQSDAVLSERGLGAKVPLHELRNLMQALGRDTKVQGLQRVLNQVLGPVLEAAPVGSGTIKADEFSERQSRANYGIASKFARGAKEKLAAEEGKDPTEKDKADQVSHNTGTRFYQAVVDSVTMLDDVIATLDGLVPQGQNSLQILMSSVRIGLHAHRISNKNDPDMVLSTLTSRVLVLSEILTNGIFDKLGLRKDDTVNIDGQDLTKHQLEAVFTLFLSDTFNEAGHRKAAVSPSEAKDYDELEKFLAVAREHSFAAFVAESYAEQGGEVAGGSVPRLAQLALVLEFEKKFSYNACINRTIRAVLEHGQLDSRVLDATKEEIVNGLFLVSQAGEKIAPHNLQPMKEMLAESLLFLQIATNQHGGREINDVAVAQLQSELQPEIERLVARKGLGVPEKTAELLDNLKLIFTNDALTVQQAASALALDNVRDMKLDSLDKRIPLLLKIMRNVPMGMRLGDATLTSLGSALARPTWPAAETERKNIYQALAYAYSNVLSQVGVLGTDLIVKRDNCPEFISGFMLRLFQAPYFGMINQVQDKAQRAMSILKADLV